MPTLSTTPDLQSRARRAGYDPKVLADATVLVVGAGALGQNEALNLTLSGVRTIRLVDGDLFEDHNRTRSPLHPRRREYRPGEHLPKASTVGRALAAVHVDDEASVLVADTWIEELGLGAFEGVDAIAACVDSLVARAHLARVAMLLDIPIVDGGFSGANLGMTVYPGGGEPGEQPCWSCAGDALPGAFSCQQYAAYAGGQGVVPAIQNGAAALGAMCAEAIVGVLHGRESEPRRVALDLRTGQSRTFRPQPDPECARRHRRLPAAVGTTLGPDASVRQLLEGFGGDDATLFLPDMYVERANCPVETCRATCDVDAPVHRWRRDPRCTGCGGPWPVSDVQLPSPDTIDAGLHAADPRGELTLAALGVRAGDVVEIDGGSHPAVRIAGGPADLFDEIPLA